MRIMLKVITPQRCNILFNRMVYFTRSNKLTNAKRQAHNNQGQKLPSSLQKPVDIVKPNQKTLGVVNQKVAKGTQDYDKEKKLIYEELKRIKEECRIKDQRIKRLEDQIWEIKTFSEGKFKTMMVDYIKSEQEKKQDFKRQRSILICQSIIIFWLVAGVGTFLGKELIRLNE